MRSLLTMLGIVIGVTSVLLSVALAQGLKKDTAAQLNQLGDNFLVVQPGDLANRDAAGNVIDINLSAGLGGSGGISTLTEQDVATIDSIEAVSSVAPSMLISGSVANEDKRTSGSTVIATTTPLPLILQREVEVGSFFGTNELDKNFVVLGDRIAQELFASDTPLGSKVDIRGTEFTVVGVMKKERLGTLGLGPDLNNAVYIPIEAGKKLSGGDARFESIYIAVDKTENVEQVIKQIEQKVGENHMNERDFTVIKQEDAIAFTNELSGIITTGTALIMSISLLVAGVGIMNIMLVSVTERTKEIGIRKAVGATNRQIRNQFFTEALVLSTLGGIIGLVISIVAALLVTAYTEITMIITPIMVVIALSVSIGIGAIFGVIPAVKAARKDPISALRNE